jgi:hypothetical protein
MRLSAAIFASVTLTLVISPVFADPPEGVPPGGATTATSSATDQIPDVDPHLQAALDLMTVTHADRNMRVMVDTLIPLLMKQYEAQHSGIDPKALQQLQSVFLVEMEKSLPDMEKLIAQIYVEHFSEDELHRIAAFYQSDVGKKYTAEVPAIVKEITPLAEQMGEQIGKKAMQRAIEKLQSQGIQL